MKLKNIFLVGTVAVAGLSSCVSEDMKNDLEKAGTGIMTLDVSLLEPETVTRAQTEVTNFPVEVKSVDGSYTRKYLSVAEVPASVELLAGDYIVSSHSNLTLQKSMDVPYYQGDETMTIRRGQTTDVDVICKMLNTHISVNYGEDFLNAFSGWTITIDDGSETAIYFDNHSVNGYYWYFENQVEDLRVTFRGTLASSGDVVTSYSTLNKSWDTVQKYGDDSKYYRGGDAIEINLGVNPYEASSGKITDIIINAYVTFAETGDEVELEVTNADNGEEPGDEPGDEPGNDGLIAITIPDPVTLSADESATADPSSGDVVMHAEKGLKSVMVHVESSSDEMMEQLAAVAEGYEGVDLVNGCEVVENQNLVEFLGGLDRQITVPNTGDTDYTFPVGQFYLFLGILPGTHNFVMTVTDMDGNTKSGTVVVTITE